jgi:hypothetical protein
MPRPAPRDPFDRLVDRCEWRGDCLVWPGTNIRGYGTFRPGTRKEDPDVYVHRWIFENTIGSIPPGYQIDHVATKGCKFLGCINPEHLEAVVPLENHRRQRLTVCRSGRHDLTKPENVQWDKMGRRRGCAVCTREREKARVR